MRFPLLALAVVGGCYGARPAANVPCAQNGDCPHGQRCEYSLSPPTCVDEATPPIFDAPVDVGVVDPDASKTIPAGATLWLRFEDDPADGALDSAGAHVAACTDCPASIAGRIGLAHDFANDRYSVTPLTDFAPGNALTVAAWFRADTEPNGSFATIVGRPGGAGAGAPDYAIFYTEAGRLDFYSSPGAGLVGPAIPLNTWHHAAFVWDGVTKRGYVDGVEVVSEAIDNLDNSTQALGVGRYPSGLAFDGAIDEVVFYPRALTPAEIMQLVAAAD